MRLGGELPSQSFAREGGLQSLGGILHNRTISGLAGTSTTVSWAKEEERRTAWGSDGDLCVEDVFTGYAIRSHIAITRSK